MTSLPRNHRDREWLHELHRALRARDRGRGCVKLLDAEWPGGLDSGVRLAFVDLSTRGAVRATDAVLAGLGVSTGPEGRTVFERLCRQVHGTGMSFPRDAASGDADGDLEAAVAGALSVSSFRGALETLRLAARIPVASVRRVLEVAAPRGRAEGALEAWRRGSDFTVYGIYNAINDDAALLSTLKERFDAEAQAAALLRRFDDAESYAREETAVGG